MVSLVFGFTLMKQTWGEYYACTNNNNGRQHFYLVAFIFLRSKCSFIQNFHQGGGGGGKSGDCWIKRGQGL